MRLCFLRRSSLLAGVSRAALLGAVFILTGTLPPASRADIQNPGRSSFPGEREVERQGEKPPNAVAQTIKVLEGGEVSIILRARGRSGEMVNFIIRTPPVHGTLDGEPRQLTLSSASVTYTPRPGDDATEDSFTFAVQTRTSPVSADQRVTVKIQEPPPSLAASPAELDFGAVKAGSSTRAELTLTNQGGGEAVGRVDPPMPWVVDGPAEYHLSRGASQTFALVFKPPAERVYSDALHLRAEAGGGVRLVGTGLAGPIQPLVPGNGRPDPTLAGQPASPGSQETDRRAAGTLPAGTPTVSPSADGTGAVAASSPAASSVTSLEPATQGGGAAGPAGIYSGGVDVDTTGVTSFTVRSQGRTTLDLGWRVPVPLPKSYRVELRYLSLDPDDKLIVDWRPYAQVEFDSKQGFASARLSGLEADTQYCVRIVAVDPGGRLSTPTAPLVIYTLPPSTWWRPTPLKVLFLLLFICGGMVWRHRWENQQILREIDASRQRTARPAGSWG